LTNKWYVFSNVAYTNGLCYLISNSICQPSYISLETALYFHQLILDNAPADSFGENSIHAITMHKTVVYQNDRGVYSYRKIKPEFYFGFETLEIDGKPIHIANPEKALIDFLYFNANLNSLSKLTSITWNIQALAQLDWKKLSSIQLMIGSKALDRRMDLLKKGLKMTDF
jgi:predicted transcriptional regulator of viral defense system